MSSGETDIDRLVTSMAPELHEDRYVFATVTSLPTGLAPVAAIRESEGLSVVVAAEQADAHGLAGEYPCAWITLRVRSALAAVGFLAVVTTALADAGISVNAVAGFHHDHLFVPWDRRHDAIATLRRLGGR